MIAALADASETAVSSQNRSITIRKASMADIRPILNLINSYAVNGVMLPRTEFELSESIRDFSVAWSGERLVGCGALHFYSPEMAEVRSLAVAPEQRIHGIGRRLIEALIWEAHQFALDAVFAFTYVPGFFTKMGFHEVERGELPLKAWRDCLRCPKFHSCDEIAVIRILSPRNWTVHHDATASLLPSDILVQLPNIKLPRPNNKSSFTA